MLIIKINFRSQVMIASTCEQCENLKNDFDPGKFNQTRICLCLAHGAEESYFTLLCGSRKYPYPLHGGFFPVRPPTLEGNYISRYKARSEPLRVKKETRDETDHHMTRWMWTIAYGAVISSWQLAVSDYCQLLWWKSPATSLMKDTESLDTEQVWHADSYPW